MNSFYKSIVNYMEQANDPGGKYGRERKPWIYLWISGFKKNLSTYHIGKK